MQDTVDIFTYQPLDPPEAIRLIDIIPSHRDPGGLVETRLRQAVPGESYRCLSYKWGDQAERSRILVNGHVFHVGRNLHDFLLHVAEGPGPFTAIWIDALCINQQDDIEKSVQVQRMGNIYSGAVETIVWLGLGTQQEIRAIRRLAAEPFMKVDWDVVMNGGEAWKTCVPQLTDEQGEVKDNANYWTAEVVEDVIGLLYNDYWNRAWIVQEILLSQSLTVWCGEERLSGKELLTLRRLILHDFIAQMGERGCDFNVQDGVGSLQWLVKSPCMALMPYPGKKRFSREYLHVLLDGFGRRDCADPRDRIFSLIATARQDDEAPSVRADYSLSAVQVFEMVWRAEKHVVRDAGKKNKPWSKCEKFARRLREVLDLRKDVNVKRFLEEEFASMGFTYPHPNIFLETDDHREDGIPELSGGWGIEELFAQRHEDTNVLPSMEQNHLRSTDVYGYNDSGAVSNLTG